MASVPAAKPHPQELSNLAAVLRTMRPSSDAQAELTNTDEVMAAAARDKEEEGKEEEEGVVGRAEEEEGGGEEVGAVEERLRSYIDAKFKQLMLQVERCIQERFRELEETLLDKLQQKR